MSKYLLEKIKKSHLMKVALLLYGPPIFKSEPSFFPERKNSYASGEHEGN
jgi:hypothetical protein